MRRLLALLVALSLAWPISAIAQAVVTNPKRIAFEPSPDHSATEPVTGQPKVTTYRLDIIEDGATVPMISADLGKGTLLTAPDPSIPANIGDIVVRPTELIGLPVGRKFAAVIVAVGPGGEAPSAASDPFGRPVPPVQVPGKPRLAK